MTHHAETATWTRQWAVMFADGNTTIPQVDPAAPQQVMASYRRTAPDLPCALVSRLVTEWREDA